MPCIIGVNKAKPFGYIITDLALNIMGNLCNAKTYALFGNRQNLVHRAYQTQNTKTKNLTSAKDLGQHDLGALMLSCLSCAVLTAGDGADANYFLITGVTYKNMVYVYTTNQFHILCYLPARHGTVV